MAFCVVGALFLTVTVALAAKPNIIFILTDDQGYGDVERHGHPLLKTPHMNRLHDEGVRFDNFFVSPSCSPTRAALMTGMHEFRNGVTHTIQPREHLWKDAVILPQLLKSAGYRTGFIGKWHLGGGRGFSPNERGFDWTATNPNGSRKHFDPEIIRNGRRSPRKGYREDLFFDEAMTFIDEAEDAPFLCYLATYSPHTPLAAPERFIAPFRGKVTEEQATYLGMVANIDYNVGRLLEFLDHHGLEQDTVLLFMNDNGQTKGLDVYNAGMRGCKCTIWEGGSRAMSFWRWPGHWKPHQVDNLAAHIDVLPTLCELAGVKVPATLQSELEGFSLVPLLEAKGPVSWYDDRMLFHHVARWPNGMAKSHKHAMCAVRQGHHLLLRSRPCDSPQCTPKVRGNQCHTLRNVEKGATKMIYTAANARFHWGVSPAGRWVLFDVKEDPACKKDLARAKPELAARMAAAYDKWWDDVYPDMIARSGDREESHAAPSPADATRAGVSPRLAATSRRKDTDGDGNVSRAASAVCSAREYRVDSQTTFDAVRSIELQPGDAILLRRGKQFTGMLAPRGRGVEGAPVRIGAYGQGRRPCINAGGKQIAGVLLKDPSYWEVQGLEITNTDGSSKDQGELFGIYVLAEGREGTYRHVYVDDCYVHDVNGKVAGKRRGGIHVHIKELKTSIFDDLRITNNRIEEVGGVGIGNKSSCGDVELLKDRVVCRHLWTRVYVAGNVVDRTGRNNIIARASKDAVYEYNVLANSSRYDTGHSIFCFDTDGIRIQYNEAYGNVGDEGKDRGGFDADYSCVNTFIQYNYSHDNNWFCGIMKRPNRHVVIRYNVSQNDREGIYFYGFEKARQACNVHIYNNTHYVKKGLDVSVFPEGRTPINSTFENNIFHFEGKGRWGKNAAGVNTVFRNNLYFNIVPHPSDTSPILANPGFVRPGRAGTGIDLKTMGALRGYLPGAGSPGVDAGKSVEGNGGVDILGTALDDAGTDVGALEFSEARPSTRKE